MNLIKKIKEKKGSVSIETVISSILILILICGFVDLTTILRKQTVISSSAKYVARTVGLQGGIDTYKPPQFKGDYVSNKELYYNLNNIFSDAGIKEDKWEVYIDNHKLTPSLSTKIYDFGQPINIRVEVKYSWSLLSNFIPGKFENKRIAERIIDSSYKVRDGNFLSEYKD